MASKSARQAARCCGARMLFAEAGRRLNTACQRAPAVPRAPRHRKRPSAALRLCTAMHALRLLCRPRSTHKHTHTHPHTLRPQWPPQPTCHTPQRAPSNPPHAPPKALHPRTACTTAPCLTADQAMHPATLVAWPCTSAHAITHTLSRVLVAHVGHLDSQRLCVLVVMEGLQRRLGQSA